MTPRHLSLWAGLLITLVACGSAPAPPPNPNALASGEVVNALAGGKLTSLPTGPLYIRVIRFVQPSGHTVTSNQHVAGFVYVEQGTHRLQVVEQPAQDIDRGEAVFLGSVTHTHSNPAPAPNSWLFIALWQSSARAKPLLDPGKLVFEIPDLAPDALPQGTYVQVLRRITLAPGGRTAAHRFGGVYVLFVLQGSITVRAAGVPPATVDMGQGLGYQPDVGLQVSNGAGDPATFVELLTTDIGKDFETVLSQPPSG